MSEAAKYWRRPPTPHTLVKTEIVLKYFTVWSQVLRGSASELLYLDLYAGRGKHENGEVSTPIRLLEQASKDMFLQQNLQVILNDVKPTYCRKLQKLIGELGYTNRFKNKPKVFNTEIDEPVAERLADVKLVPTFCFIDPYGYKGLSQSLVSSVIKDFGSDCLVFLHSSGINRNITNDLDKRKDVIPIFGQNRFDELLALFENPRCNRISAVAEAFRAASRDVGARYSSTLQFNRPNSKRISHHLVFLSKNILGFRIMRDIMAGFSLKDEGIPRYVYIEGSDTCYEQLHFKGISPMQLLKDRVLLIVGESEKAVGSIVDEIDESEWNYTAKNVKTAVMTLVKEEFLKAVHPVGKIIRKNTMPDQVLVSVIKSRVNAKPLQNRVD